MPASASLDYSAGRKPAIGLATEWLPFGQAHDLTAGSELLSDPPRGAMPPADKAYDADWLRAKLRTKISWANIPSKSNRKRTLVFSPRAIMQRDLTERFVSKVKC